MLRRTWDHDCGDLLEGGVAEGSEVMPGSTISRVTLFRQAPKGNVLSGKGVTDYLGWDATVAALASLPPMAINNEVIILMKKHIRRVPIVKVKVQYPPTHCLRSSEGSSQMDHSPSQAQGSILA